MATPTMPAPRSSGCPLDPPADFARWREDPGLCHATNLFTGELAWVVSRYEEIRAALTDPRLSANSLPDSTKVTGDEDETPVFFARTDDPEHNRLRRMLTRDFTVRRAKEMAPDIQKLVDGFLDTMIAAGPPSDLVRDFALPVPSLVICLLLGVPYEDHEFFEEHSVAGLDVKTTDEQRIESIMTMINYITELLQRKKPEPGDDLLSRLMNENVANGDISVMTAAMTGWVMLQAGHETTASMIGLGTLVLLKNPDAFAILRDGDSAAGLQVVDELLRYLTIVHSGLVDRVATEDFELGGQLISKGDHVMMNLTAGNYDPVFTARPELFDVDRNNRGHLAFGYGIHQCVGQNLARTELQIALTSLARRLPTLRLAVPEEDLDFMNDQAIWRLKELPVTW
ncbi:cytochrome P450 [Mycolicibacterium sp. BK556]|nr:cytochrome P450 [Mycolicibacterium sp. BK556]MBB3634672.1 cytochrome P450 [Mycolicibacterium sp. BK607]